MKISEGTTLIGRKVSLHVFIQKIINNQTELKLAGGVRMPIAKAKVSTFPPFELTIFEIPVTMAVTGERHQQIVGYVGQL